MASHNIPNRPAGTDPRSIADILGNFDYITGLTEGLAEGSGIESGAINTSKIVDEAVTGAKIAEGTITSGKLNLYYNSASALWEFAGGVVQDGKGVGTICSVGSVPPGIYLVMANGRALGNSHGDLGFTSPSTPILDSSGGTVSWTPSSGAPKEGRVYYGPNQGISPGSKHFTLFGIANVTSSTTLSLRLSATSGTGTWAFSCGLLIFGIKS